MHTKNIFLIILIFFNNVLSHPYGSFLSSFEQKTQEAKNLVTKLTKNVGEKQLPSNLWYIVRLFRLYCIITLL